MNYSGLLDDFSKKEYVIKDRVKADYLTVNENEIVLSFPDDSQNFDNAVAFAILDSQNRYLWYQSCKITGDSYTLKLDNFDYLFLDKVPLRFKLYIVFEYEGVLNFNRLFSKKLKDEYAITQKKGLLYFDSVAKCNFNGDNVSLLANSTISGYLGFILIKQSSRIDYIVSNTVEHFRIVDNTYCFDVKIDKIKNTSSFGVTFKSVVSGTPNCYDITPYSLEEKDSCYIAECRLPRNFFSGNKTDVLNLSTYYVINGDKYIVSVKVADKKENDAILFASYMDKVREDTTVEDVIFSVTPNKRLQCSGVLPYNGVKITPDNSPKRIVFSPAFLPKTTMYGAQRVDNRGNLRISLFADLSCTNDINVFVHSKSKMEKVILDVANYDGNKNEITIDFSAFKKNLNDFNTGIYDICIAFSYKGNMYCSTVTSPEYEVTSQKELDTTLPVISEFAVQDSIMILQPVYSSKGSFCIKVTDKLFSNTNDVVVKYRSCHFKDNYMYLTADITDNSQNFLGFALSYRYKDSEDKRIYHTKGELAPSGNRTLLKGIFNLSLIELRSNIWDIYAIYSDGENTYFAGVHIDKKHMYDYMYRKSLFQTYYRFSDEKHTEILFPYFESNGRVSLMMRKLSRYDSKKIRIKEMLAVCCHKLLKGHYKRKKIALVYEKNCFGARDNGYAIFAHCMKHKVEKRLRANIYYIIDTNSPDYKNVKRYGDKVIPYMSFKHMLYLLGARLFISPESKDDSYLPFPNNSIIGEKIKPAKFLYLQKGVSLYEKNNPVLGVLKRGSADVVTVASNKEKNYIKKEYGYSENKVGVTGLARWDSLADTSQKTNEIAIIPSNRSWLEGAESSRFMDSEFCQKYTQLLKNPKFNEILSENGLKAIFYVDKNIKKHFKNISLNSRNISVVSFDDVTQGQLIMRSKVLITDYNSIAFDMIYLCKPVLFYQFDYGKYMEITDSFVDMEQDLIGDRVTTLPDLCSILSSYVENNFRIPSKYKLMRDNSFSYFDQNNALRIVQEIRKMKW